MNEQMPTFTSQEENLLTPEELQRKEDDERCAEFEASHPELFVKAEPKREQREGLTEFEVMVDKFEKEFSIEVLMAIATEQEAKESSVRESAKEALGAIFKEFKDSGSEYNPELKARWKRISNAVGYINYGTVYHDR